jgi:RsiW-degrading membrane proteinase PrsW (M82 family)
MSTTAPPTAPPAARRANDVLVIVLGGASVVLAVGLAVVEALHLLPTALALGLVIAFSGIALRVLLRLRASRSSALSNPRVMEVVSYVLLGVAFISAVVNFSVALRGHDPGQFVTDLVQRGWSLLLVGIVAIPVRTVGWRVVLGTLLCAVLAVPSIAVILEEPVVAALGGYDQFTVGFYVPVVEEVLKAAPIALFVILAARNRSARPAALDYGLLGFVSGTGFALIEDAVYGRAAGRWDAVPPLSGIFPSMDITAGFVSQGQVVAGHAIWTGFVGLGLGFGLLYQRRWRFAWVAIPATLALSVLEHCLANVDLPPVPLVILTASGTLVTILFMLGMVGLAVFERRPFRSLRDILAGVLVSQPTLGIQRANLAARQARRPRPANGAVR